MQCLPEAGFAVNFTSKSKLAAGKNYVGNNEMPLILGLELSRSRIGLLSIKVSLEQI